MSISTSNIGNTQFFGTWLTRTNQMASIISQNTVTADASSNGSLTTGNSYVNGYFGTNILASPVIQGGTIASPNNLLISTNTLFQSNILSVLSNTTNSSLLINSNNIIVNNSTNVIGNINFSNTINSNGNINSNTSLSIGNTFGVNTTILNFGSNVIANNSSLLIGNSTVYSLVNSTSEKIVEVGSNLIISSSSIIVNYSNTSSFISANASGITIGNSTSNTISNSSSISINGLNAELNIGSNVNINTSSLSFGNSTVNTILNNAIFVSGNSTVYNTSNSSLEIFTTPTSNLIVNSSQVFIGNSLIHSTVNSTIFSGTSYLANNSFYLGGLSANAYQTVAGLPSNVATLTSNNSINLNGKPSSYYANITSPIFTTSSSVGSNVISNTTAIMVGNSTLKSVITSTNLETPSISTSNLIVNGNGAITGSLVVHGNVTYSGTSIGNGSYTPSVDAIYNIGNSTARWLDGYLVNVISNTIVTTTTSTNTINIGNSTSNTTINSTSFGGTSNNTLYVGSVSSSNVVSNAQLTSNLTNYQTIAGLPSNVATLTSNNSINLNGKPSSYYANITSYPGAFNGTTVNGTTGIFNTGLISEGYDSNGAQIRIISGNSGIIFRTDTTNMNLLQTASGNASGTWNSYRPFSWNLINGSVTIDGSGQGTIIGSTTSINTGVIAYSGSGNGVIGHSTSGFGIFGSSANNIGIYGISTSDAIVGNALTNGRGVVGYSNSNAAVFGLSSTGYGGYFQSNTSYGIKAISITNHGIIGDALTGGWGLWGLSNTGYGGYFQSNTGMIAGFANNTSLNAYIDNGGNFYSSGSINVTGNIVSNGTILIDSGTLTGTNYSGTSNNSNYLGGTAASSYQLNSTLASNVATLTSNNTLYVNGIPSSNIVSSSQLQGNLVNYQTTAGLSSNVITLSSNNSTYLNGEPSSYYANVTSYPGAFNGTTINASGAMSISGTSSLNGVLNVTGDINGGSKTSPNYYHFLTNVSQNATSNNFATQSFLNLNGARGNYLSFGQQTNFAQWIQSGYSAANSTSVASFYDIILNPLGGNIGIGNTIPTNTLSVEGSVYVSGNVNLSSVINSTSAAIFSGYGGTQGQITLIEGNYGFIERNDGTNYYQLITASGNSYGNWNNFRPYTINLINGQVSIDETGQGVLIGSATSSNTGLIVYSNNAAAIFGESNSYNGVAGNTNTGTGVYGQSISGYGVLGVSTSSQGVQGQSTSGSGLVGYTNSAYGVFGQSNVGPGVQGQSTSGPGLGGYSTTGNLLELSNNSGTAAFFNNNGTLYGPDLAMGNSSVTYNAVVAETGTAIALVGTSNSGYGGWLTSSSGIGLQCNSGGTYLAVFSNNTTALCYIDNTGKLTVGGDLVVGGTATVSGSPIATTSWSNVGSFALGLITPTANLYPGNVVSGASITSYYYSPSVGAYEGNGTLPGSWMCLGFVITTVSQRNTLFSRIS